MLGAATCANLATSVAVLASGVSSASSDFSAIRRIGHGRWLRNLALAAGNALTSPRLQAQEREDLRQTLTAWAQHPDPVVQEQVALMIKLEVH